jgi:hypothetical protein
MSIQSTAKALMRQLGRSGHARRSVGSSWSRIAARISFLHDAEFHVYPQFGEDGIIEWLI